MVAMKHKHRFLIALLGFVMVVSCKSDDEGDVPATPNQNPESFEVEISDLNSRSAMLNWSDVTDPDEDAVTYTIWLGDDEIQSGFSESEFLFEGLQPETGYTGMVTANDGKGGVSETAFAFTTESLSIGWKRFLGGSANDVARSIVATSDGGYVAAGHASTGDGDVGNNKGETDIWVTKLDENGNLVWENNYGGTEDDRANEIIQLSDGGFLVAGYSFSSDGDVTSNNGLEDFWVIRLDQSGSLVWKSSLGGSGADIAESVIETSDGGFIVAGYTYSSDDDIGGDNNGGADFWIVKMNQNGDDVWERNFGGTDNEFGESVREAADGGFVIVGSALSSDGDVGNNSGEEDMWVIKVSNDGDLEWESNFGGSAEDRANELFITSDDEIYISGFSESADGDVGNNSGLSDFWVVKLDNSGDLIWENNYGGTDQDIARSIDQTTDGGFVITGRSSSSDGDVGSNEGNWDYWILKIDDEGEVNWETNLGGTKKDNAWAVRQSADGTYVVAGSARSEDGDVGGNKGGQDFWIVKLQ